MTLACPNGHLSETTDYCDQCGARIDGPGAGSPPVPTAGPPPSAVPGPSAPPNATVPVGPLGSPGQPATPGPPDPGPGPAGTAAGGAAGSRPGDQPCPVCLTARVGEDRFCEGCGYDFTSPAVAAGAGDPGLGTVAGTNTAAWEAIAVADRDYFDRVAPEGVTFPLHCPPRTFLLAGDQIRVGRHSNSRGIQPEVDLSGAPEDSAISHLHCILIAQPDGSYSVVDPGSTNGTTVNDDSTPLTANSPIALADGDRVHIGAWTTITIRARPAAGPSTAAP